MLRNFFKKKSIFKKIYFKKVSLRSTCTHAASNLYTEDKAGVVFIFLWVIINWLLAYLVHAVLV